MTRIDGNSQSPTHNDVSVIQSVDQLAIQLGGDPQAYLAAMVLQFAGERRNDAENARNTAETRIQQQENLQVREMRDQADMIRTSAWISGAGGVLGGVGQIGGGAALLKGNVDLSKIYEGSGMVLNAVGDGGSGVANGAAKDDEADSIAASHRAQANLRRLDAIEDDIDSANDMEDRALDFLEQINKTKAETEQSLYIRG